MIILMRHGETEHKDGFFGRTDSQLTETGFQHMLQQAKQFSFDAIISSPLQRCAQVAQTLATAQNCPVIINSHWQEYNFGDWEGKSIAQLWQTHPQALEQLWQDPTKFTPPNAEVFTDFMQRVSQATEQLRDHHQQLGNILVLTHAGVIRSLRLLSQQNQHHDWLTYPVEHASLHYLCPTTFQVTPYES